MRSRYLLELTTPEVAKYLADGGDLALLPTGPTEMHGPHLPLGTDLYVARAVALRVAEVANGVVLPDLAYNWSGATDGFPGTLSIEPELMQQMVASILRKALRMGFQRLVVISAHGPNDAILMPVARRFFEVEGVPVFVPRLISFNDPKMRAIFAEPDTFGGEGTMVLGALHVLGQPELYSEAEMRRADHAPDMLASLRRLGGAGTVGYFFQDPRQHACPSEAISLQRGVEFIEGLIPPIVAALGDLSQYIADLKTMKNTGTSRV
jgi:creatinine amidohydrolase